MSHQQHITAAEYRYTIPEIPPSTNNYIGRTNYRAYQAEKKRWADLVAVYCRRRPEKPLVRARVKLHYYFPTRHRHDPDNYSGKMILDGLTNAKIIKDDCFGMIDLELVGAYDRDNPRTEITITELPVELRIIK